MKLISNEEYIEQCRRAGRIPVPLMKGELEITPLLRPCEVVSITMSCGIIGKL